MGNGQSTSSSIDQIKQIYAIYANSLIKKQKLKPDKQKVSRDVIKQLFQSFTKYRQYCWSQDITPLFVSFFKDNLETLWNNDRQIFYRQMLQNSGLMNNNHRKITNYQDQFYNCQAIKLKQEQEIPDTRSFDNRINALNCSIIDQEEMLPILINKKPKPNNKSVMHHSMMQFENNFEFSHDSENLKHNSEYYDSQILRSSVIVPETVFVERLDDNSKYKVNNLLNFYKIFSESLQQMIRNITLMACPLKHFEAELKRKVKLKKIKSIEQTGSVIRDTRNAALLRKKKQYNNTYLLLEIRDFTEGYTQFIWKYLNLYRFDETQFSTFITIETAYGVVLKLVWSFTSWIGQRGYEWEQNQIPKALQQFAEQQRLSFSGSDKKKKKKNKIQISPQIIKLGSDLTEQTNPQKYLKKIVIIYRQLSKNCSSADQLMTHYQIFFQQLAKRNKCQRLLRMQLIIQKLLKMEDSCGQICYAWTTWNIMIETIKKIISAGTKEKEVQQDFKKFLDKVEKSRLSG